MRDQVGRLKCQSKCQLDPNFYYFYTQLIEVDNRPTFALVPQSQFQEYAIDHRKISLWLLWKVRLILLSTL